MQFDEYQAIGARTEGEVRDEATALSYGGLGLTGEAGEVADAIKKMLWHGHSESEMKNKIIEEMGDTLWYLAYLARRLGVSLDSIAKVNIVKLAQRYPNGFSKEASINRT